MSDYIMYEHHNEKVYVREDLKGKHREMCLCWNCKRFIPDTEENCTIAKALFKNCKRFHVVTPVFECPYFEEDSE